MSNDEPYSTYKFKSKALSYKWSVSKLEASILHFDTSIWPVKLRTGVYAARVQFRQSSHWYLAVLYFGPLLTLKKTTLVLEIRLFADLDELKAQEVSVEVGEWIRAPQVFSQLRELQAQIQKDVRRLKFSKKQKL